MADVEYNVEAAQHLLSTNLAVKELFDAQQRPTTLTVAPPPVTRASLPPRRSASAAPAPVARFIQRAQTPTSSNIDKSGAVGDVDMDGRVHSPLTPIAEVDMTINEEDVANQLSEGNTLSNKDSSESQDKEEGRTHSTISSPLFSPSPESDNAQGTSKHSHDQEEDSSEDEEEAHSKRARSGSKDAEASDDNEEEEEDEEDEQEDEDEDEDEEEDEEEDDEEDMDVDQ